MRSTSTIPIRRVLRGTHWDRRPVNPQTYPVSPAVEELLRQPTWSVRSLLPPSSSTTNATPSNKTAIDDQPRPGNTTVKSTSTTTTTKTTSLDDEITPTKLRHLLKLSALPPPSSPTEEARMLSTLRSQIHFVKAIQSVDTTGIDPLITIRDETAEAHEEETITLEKMLPFLAMEEKIGRNGTVRRRDVVRTEEEDREERRKWEVDVGRLTFEAAEKESGDHDGRWGQGGGKSGLTTATATATTTSSATGGNTSSTADKRRKGKFFYVRRARTELGTVARGMEGVSRPTT